MTPVRTVMTEEAGTKRPRWRRILRIVGLGAIGLVAVAQLVPYGRAHTNPTVVAEPPWDQPATRALAVRACFDCHSNETHWPWYSHVAPASWMLQNHVDEGRETLNFSEWNRGHQEAGEAGDEVRDGEMPPRSYLLLHPEARLSAAEKDALARGLDASLGATRD